MNWGPNEPWVEATGLDIRDTSLLEPPVVLLSKIDKSKFGSTIGTEEPAFVGTGFLQHEVIEVKVRPDVSSTSDIDHSAFGAGQNFIFEKKCKHEMPYEVDSQDELEALFSLLPRESSQPSVVE